MLVPLAGLAAIALGLVFVLADEKIGRNAVRGPETGAARARILGFILLVGGALTFLGTGA
ncbi:MAG TPA: hypothetical protein VHG91_19590 [Longimicrobium sp.]|nr:hypothetical protein [Longimicrobium sp.]